MTAPNVRSATVTFRAEVAKYMADVRAAGKVTRDAFSDSRIQVAGLDKDLQSATKSSDKLAKQTRTTSRETTGLGDSIGKTTGKVKEYNLEMALADERASRLRASLREQARAALDAEAGLDKVSDTAVRTSVSVDRVGNSIDRTSGRLAIMAKLAGAGGAGLIPVGAVGIAGIAGLASQIGFAATGITSLVVASQGLGDALKAVEAARLEPTVANLQAAREALRQISPEARAFVASFQQMRPVFADIRDQAAAGWFPGLVEALDHFEDIAPRVGQIFNDVGETGGRLVADAAESLAGPEWSEFLSFIQREAPRALETLGRTAGNVAHGLAELWMAFTPVNNDFGGWLLDTSRAFDDWASNLSQTDGFREFVDYLRTNGPKLADATVAIANALIQIVEAAAPLGGPILDAITAFAEAIATIADSPLGTPIFAAVSAMSALSLATNVATAATLRLKAAQSTLGVPGGGKTPAAPGAVPVGGGIAGGLALIGLMDTAPDYIQNLQLMADGERNVFEGLARMAAGANPVGAALNLLGVDILGVDDKAGSLGSRMAALAIEQQGATGSSNHLSNALTRASDRQLRASQRAAQLREAMAEQRDAVRQTADQWTDYSQRVQLGDTSVDQLINRWDKLGDASANMAENIQDALGRGLDPQIIKDVIDTLGPQGAALALEQFANASGARAREIEEQFRRMSEGVGAFGDSYELLSSLLSGTPLSLNNDLIFELDQAKAAFDSLPREVRTAIRADGLPQTEAEINHLVDKYELTERERTALITLADQASPDIRAILGLLAQVKDKHVTVTTTYIRELITKRSTIPQSPTNPSLEGLLGVPGGADGGTVPGHRLPYRDKVLIHAAPGEEIISNRYGQADRFRADRAAGRIPAYADGGTVLGSRHDRLVRILNERGLDGPLVAGQLSRGVASADQFRHSPAPLASGTGVVRHVFEHHVIVDGKLDARQAVAQFRTEMTRVSADEISQHERFWRDQR